MQSVKNALITFLLTSLCVTSYLSGQAPDTLWTKTYGGPGADQVTGVLPTADGGFIWAGESPHDSLLPSDIWVFKTDADGNILWEDRRGRADSTESITSFEPAWDSGYLMAGYVANSNSTTDANIIKLNTDGQNEWWFNFGITAEATQFSGVVASPIGGAVAVGRSTLSMSGANVYIVGTFVTGLYMWHDIFDWDWSEIARHICRTSDGGYMVTGETNSFGLHTYGMFMQKLDAMGFPTGRADFNWEGDQYGNYVQETPDHGYIVAGYQNDNGSMDTDVYIVKTDSLLTAEWIKTYGGLSQDKATCVQVLSDGYIVAGTGQKSSNPYSQDFYILRLDWNGDTLWTKYIGDYFLNEYATQIRQTSDGGYIISGFRAIDMFYNSDAYLVRLAPDTLTSLNTYQAEVPQNYILNQNYPNPFNPSTTIQFQLPEPARVTLKIYDPLGKEIATLINEQLAAGQYEKIWQPGDLPSGIYFYQLKANDFLTVKKLILMN